MVQHNSATQVNRPYTNMDAVVCRALFHTLLGENPNVGSLPSPVVAGKIKDFHLIFGPTRKLFKEKVLVSRVCIIKKENCFVLIRISKIEVQAGYS